MKRTLLFILLVVVVCTPLLLVSLFVTAAYVPAFDRLTLNLPPALRTAMAEAAMQKVGFGDSALPKIQRVIRLDPANAEAWTRLCSNQSGTNLPAAKNLIAIATCQRAVDLNPSTYNLFHLALAQERSGDPCKAQGTFTAANRASTGDADDLRGMGRTSLACGDTLGSVAELEAARDLDAKAVADPEQDAEDRDDDAADLQTDQQWLVLAYTAQKRPKLAAEACSKAYPKWKSCSCTLQSGKPSCVENQPAAIR